MKKFNSISNLIQKAKFGFILSYVIFGLCSTRGYCQSPELFVDKVLINNIGAPWGFTFINSNEVLFTEKQGKVFRYVISTNTRVEVTGVPAISQNGQGGLLDIALHPDFSSNNFVYLTYAVNATGGQTTALGRGRLVGNQLQNFTELFRALPIRNSGQHFGSRIVFDKNNMLYMSVGDRGTPDEAQNKNNHLGKVLRFNDDGTVPPSNPLVGVPNTQPQIFCWGNRNIQGMAMNPATGEIYAHEHGPRGGDELNLIKPNTNYGWPKVTFGIDYNGSIISSDTTLPGMVLPLTYWVPSIAPSGMTFIRNGQANNEADILIGALAGTHIHWLKMKNDKRISSTRSMNGYGRFRDVRQAPDGKLFAMTESPNRFVLLRSNIPIVNATSSNSITCLTPSTTLVVTSDVNNATITWSGPGITPDNSNQSTLSVTQPGIYFVTVLNPVNNLSTTAQLEVLSDNAAAPDATITSSSSNLTCATTNVSLSAPANTGFIYQWSGPGITSGVQSSVVMVNQPGQYSVSITNPVNGCLSSNTIMITQSPEPVLTMPIVKNVSCFNGSNGSTTIQFTGGTAPFQYNWSNGSTSQSITDLPSGAYNYTLTDVHTCQQMGTVLISAPTEIILFPTLIHPSCISDSNGAIQLTATGGTPPYTYQFPSNNGNLPSGSYTVNAVDSLGCTASLDVVLLGEDKIKPIVKTKNLSLELKQDGKVDLIASNFDDGSTDNCSTNLLFEISPASLNCSNIGDNVVWITVKDENGNSDSKSSVVSISDGLKPSIICPNSITSNKCQRDVIFPAATAFDNCSIKELTLAEGLASGGIFPVGITNQIFKATDSSGNEATCKFTVTIINDLTVTGTIQEIKENSPGVVSLSVNGGNTPYTFAWAGPNGFTSEEKDVTVLNPGLYIVTVKDDFGCETSNAFAVDLSTSLFEQNNLSFQIYPNPVSELLFIDLGDMKVDFGNLEIQIYDATGKIMTNLNPSLNSNHGFTLDVSNLLTGIYFVRLKDLTSDKQGIMKVDVIK